MSWKSKYGKINLEVFRYGIFDKKQTPTGGFIQRDTPPVSEGPRHFGLNMFAPDGTRLTDGDGNWVGPISRLAPEYRKYVKKPASKKKTTKAKPKKK